MTPPVSIYRLGRSPLDAVLPVLLQKSLEQGMRAVVRAAPEMVAALNRMLWTWRDDSFLPHGSREDGPPGQQPVYLTGGGENPNDAELLVILDGAEAVSLDNCRRCLYLFDGGDPEAAPRADALQRDWQAQGAQITRWQQDDSGNWKQAQ